MASIAYSAQPQTTRFMCLFERAELLLNGLLRHNLPAETQMKRDVLEQQLKVHRISTAVLNQVVLSKHVQRQIRPALILHQDILEQLHAISTRV